MIIGHRAICNEYQACTLNDHKYINFTTSVCNFISWSLETNIMKEHIFSFIVFVLWVRQRQCREKIVIFLQIYLFSSLYGLNSPRKKGAMHVYINFEECVGVTNWALFLRYHFALCSTFSFYFHFILLYVISPQIKKKNMLFFFFSSSSFFFIFFFFLLVRWSSFVFKENLNWQRDVYFILLYFKYNYATHIFFSKFDMRIILKFRMCAVCFIIYFLTKIDIWILYSTETLHPISNIYIRQKFKLILYRREKAMD